MMNDEAVIIVVDDDGEWRASLANAFGGDGLRVETFADAEGFLAEYEGRQPAGCLVTELCLRGMGGLELQHALGRLGWTLPIVFLSSHGTVQAAVRAMKAGAVTFLEKKAEQAEVVAQVRAALARDAAARAARAERARTEACLATLSNREREVLRQVLAGKTSREIAEELYLSDKTIQLHRARIMKKTGAGNVVRLAQMAIQAPT